MLFVGTSIIHPSTEGVFLLCNILDLLIYSYKDINGVTQTDVLKKFRVGLFKKQYYTLKNVEFDICGIIKTAAFDSNFVPDAETSLRGMESYIREKKF